MPILKVKKGEIWEEVFGNSASPVFIDPTLTKEEQAADAAAVGNKMNTKVNLPQTSDGNINYGTTGQFAISDGNGGIIWKSLVNAEEVDY